MLLHHLEIRDLRNLQSVSMHRLERINLLCGPNGSGKTSVLEAIYLLGLGRPMRGRGMQPVIRHGAEQCVVSAELQPSGAEARGATHLGLSRHRRGETVVRIDGEMPSSKAALVAELPLQLINARAASLLSGAPMDRRRFMDWCMFHMEPTFLQQWRRYHRCLKQYNRLLRLPSQASAQAQRSGWAEQLVETGAALDGARSRWAKAFEAILSVTCTGLLDADISLRYLRGWPGSQSLADYLQDSWAKDREAAHLRHGPHCADLRFHCRGSTAVDRLSSGQLKLLAVALRLAAGRQLLESCGKRCIFLVDDLAAELDRHAKQRLCQLLEHSGHQIFASCIELDDLNPFLPQHSRCDFQLQQGQLSRRAA